MTPIVSRTHLKGVMEKVSTFGKSQKNESKTISETTVATGEIEANDAKQSRKEALQDIESKEVFGAGEEIRTPDQRLGKPMRYHCATPALRIEVVVCLEKVAQLIKSRQVRFALDVAETCPSAF